MKNIAKDLKFGRAAMREKPISTHVPYSRHVTETVIALKNGAAMSVIALDGLNFQTLDQQQLNMRAAVHNTIIRALGSSRYSIWSTVIRSAVEADIEGGFEDNNFCEVLNDRYHASLRKKRMFRNELYIAVVLSQQRSVLGLADQLKRLLSGGFKKPVVTRTSPDVVELTEKVQGMVEELAVYGARVLGIAQRQEQPYSEACEYLNSLVMCGVKREMRLPRMSLAGYLGMSRLWFAKRSIESDTGVEDEHRFGAMLSIKEYPPFTAPGMFDNLLQINQELILTQSFTICDKPIAHERIARVQRQIRSSDARGSDLETDVDFALNSLMNQESVFGWHHLSVLAISRKLEDLGKAVSEIGSCLTDNNIAWLREDLNSEASFWAQLPGNHAYIARTAMLASSNFAGLSSMHNFPVGRMEGVKWGCPIALLETTSQTPFYFNFHNSQGLGHFLVTGPSGSGKTVALTFLFAQAMRVQPRPKAVFFDKDRGAEIFIRAMDGNYELLDPDVQTGFNPLQIDDTTANRDFLTQLFRVMLRLENVVGQEQLTVLERAVASVMAYPLDQRNLNNFRQLLAGASKGHADDLAARLSPWVDGDKAWVFNSKEDTLSFGKSQVFGFDMTKILGMPDVSAPVLMYLFFRVQELLTGDPVMIFMDEGWQLLNDKAFMGFIVDLMKTIRKRNGIVGFGTQSASDIAKSPVSNTLIEQSATHIHFPNAMADEESYIDRFQLSKKEFRFLRETGPEKRAFLIKTGNESVVARLDLSDMRDLVKVLSGTETTIRECASLRWEHGDRAADWLPIFCGWEDRDAAE
ncbi:VirB4 family type IV secretion/conjugal transfer ATPase [Agrobacterium vitis]|uniref:VirB4 family type IV secretion/conjugal transfer ATPase n=1 Tax=Allorhizobium ampelinum TaxID=3025782 RepID=UPI001F39D0BC|nr:VirB4 family type IV secretion/conjugal transfer ATPase [Allorhizobium ampelinum]MCF1450520.1 VirB4 family type IV secretion/conjugal transfer ATPase [Allorhizobium ampelinum]